MRRKIISTILIIILLAGCIKQPILMDTPVLHYLKTHLSNADFLDLDKTAIKENNYIVRLSFKKEPQKQIILKKKADGSIENGKILEITGYINAAGYQGILHLYDMNGVVATTSLIKDGFIQTSHTTALVQNSLRRNETRCYDCTIPEVMVSATYKSPYYDTENPFAWLSLFWLFGGDMPKTEYLPLSGGGGASETIDTEQAENKPRADAKKYMDCFDNLPDVGATCTITISTDVPVDNRPDAFFDPAAGAVGHTFIELWKMTPSGQLITQTIGFYPEGSFKAATGLNVESKIVDNAFHEYNARYTISVTPTQLRAAINQVRTLEHHNYNLATFNCTDFALAVFNAAGGNLTIPKYQIPAYGTSTGSNTPQGLYQKLMEMGSAGNTNVQTNGAKGYAGASHGPCN